MSSNSGSSGENKAEIVYIIILEKEDFIHTYICIHMGGVS